MGRGWLLGEQLEQRDGLQGASESCAPRDQASRATRGLGGWRQLNSYKVLLGWLVSLGCLGHSALRSVARRARPLGGVL